MATRKSRAKRIIRRVRVEVAMTLPVGKSPDWGMQYVNDALQGHEQALRNASRETGVAWSLRISASSTEYLPPLNQEP